MPSDNDTQQFDLVIFDSAPQVQRTGRREAYCPTPEELDRVSEAWIGGASKAEVLQMMNWKAHVWEEFRRPGGILSHLPSKQGQGGGRYPRVRGSRISDEPSPAQIAEIEQRKLEVRSRWTETEEMQRRGIPIVDPAQPIAFAAAPARGVVMTRFPSRWA